MDAELRARKVATAHGAIVYVVAVRPRLDVTVDAPCGMLWSASDAHALVQAQDGGMSTDDVWSSLSAKMREGTRRCRKMGCDVCADARTANAYDR